MSNLLPKIVLTRGAPVGRRHAMLKLERYLAILAKSLVTRSINRLPSRSPKVNPYAYRK